MVEDVIHHAAGEEPAPGAPAGPTPFEQLTLWQVLGRFLRDPGTTLRRLFDLLRDFPRADEPEAARAEAEAPPPRAHVEAPSRPAAARPPLARLIVLLHGAQSLFIVWLLIVLLLMAEPPATFQAQQFILVLWMAGNSAVVYGVWRGWTWANRALALSEGALTLLSLLAALQWAQYAGVDAPAYASWAGAFALVNLALGAALAYAAARIPPDRAGGAPPLWVADFWGYLGFLAMWAALLLAVAADSILAGLTPAIRRSPDLLYQGSPVLCAGMVLWLLAAGLAWQRKRLARLFTPCAGAEALTTQSAHKPVMALPGASPDAAAESAGARADSAAVEEFIAAMKMGQAAEPSQEDGAAEIGEVVDSEAAVLPPATDIAPAPPKSLVAGAAAALTPATRRRVALPRRDAPGMAVIAVALLALAFSTAVLVFVEPVRALGVQGWAALVILWTGGSLLCLLVLGVSWPRVMLGQAALLLSFAAFEGAAANRFTPGGVTAWVFSVIFWWLALRDPDAKGPDLLGWLARAHAWLQNPTVAFRLTWTPALLIVITLAGAFFRFYDLDGVPPEMTSDAVEKLLDAARVFGDLGPDYAPNPQVFFPNNGGREPIQMYLVALTHRVTGIPYNFTLLKIVSALEAVVTIPLMYWMGKELVGARAGLIAAALVAVSYWHTVLGRMGLRIVLTPLFMTAMIVYLVRAMRRNRRADFLKAGLALGVGVYAYQALRMAPVFVIVAVGLAFLFMARSAADRRRYLFNTLALAVIAAAVFVPMMRFMLESPELFWMRTAGRLGGEPEERGEWVEDPAAQLAKSLDQLAQNYNTAIWMYNWKGDVQWISNVPNQPQLDPLSGALLALGLAAWLFRLARRRDPVGAAMLVVVAVMLLPSALALAYPNENPSATRASGTLPLIYLFAALALDEILAQGQRALRGRASVLVSAGVALALVYGAAAYNYDTFFNAYRESYYLSAKPHRAVGRVVRGFADSIGSMDTVFIVGYPHWLDHRAVGIEAGDITWGWINRNTLGSVEEIHAYLPAARSTALLVIYNQADTKAFEYLRSVLPEGKSMRYRVPGDPAKDFYLYVVPAPELAPMESLSE